MSGWADDAIRELRAGRRAEVRPKGTSMMPIIHSGDLVRLEPVTAGTSLAKGDVVLCKVKGNTYLHKIADLTATFVQIENNRGHVNGWTARENIFGRRLP